MQIVIFGHRGTGKSTFLKAWSARDRSYEFVDLDEAIEASSNKTIAQIFEQDGEQAFRSLELAEFNRQLARLGAAPFVLAVGAGFVGPIPQHLYRVWLRRLTDSLPRIFVDRPRLHPERSRAEDYLSRFEERDLRFEAWCDEQWFLPEATSLSSEDVPWIIGEVQGSIKPTFTLTSRLVRQPNKLNWFINRVRQLDVQFFELRDDLLDEYELAMAIENLPASKILVSLRRHQELPVRRDDLVIDWPVEFGVAPAWAGWASLHRRVESQSFADCQRELEKNGSGRFLKLALPVRDFVELEQGHNWWKQDPQRRSFLPCSLEGRWNWYRAWLAGKNKLNFVKTQGSRHFDQPFLWQLAGAPHGRNFAAVLGSPIHHSLSPSEHRAFFSKQGMPFYAIDIHEDEFAEAFQVLSRLGLTHAAVTSPLKKSAAQISQLRNFVVEETRAANTLFMSGQSWKAHNTDLAALKKCRETIENGAARKWAIWGGGGLLESLQQVWPEAGIYSSRTGELKGGVPTPTPLPDALVWSAPSRADAAKPPANWPIRVVLDLNYLNSSKGLNFALEIGAEYLSGLELFKLQAKAQREFWTSEQGP